MSTCASFRVVKRFVPVLLAAAALAASAPAAAAGSGAEAARCGSVSYGGKTYVLGYKGLSCASARRKVRHVNRTKSLGGWKCSSGSKFRTGGYCKKGSAYFTWHPGD